MNFTVYKSSAGSGKTYTLVKEYLKIALQNEDEKNYRGILAITFTNKATSEMKERIISALKMISSSEKQDEKSSSLKNDLVSELNVDEDILRKRAQRTLTHILHHYTDFSISTIDKFVYKVVRAFARDLHIPMNFDVQLDADSLLSTAIDQLISKAGTDNTLTKILVEFTEKKTDDEKSWNIENDLKYFAQEMLKEDEMEHLAKLKELDIDRIFKIKDELFKQTKVFESEVKKYGKDALAIIENSGVGHSSFAGGKNGLPKYFSYLSDFRTDNLTPSATIQNNIEQEKWFATKATEADKENIRSIKNQLSDFFLKAKNYIDKNSNDYFLFRLILQNIYSLAVLRELELIIEEIKTEKNIIHISEFNKRIAAIVTKESAPFIYERLGEKYQHFLIDEFQDTSNLQWQNLLPLVHNSLSEGKFNMIVGDGKQAIYRWRSGDVEQFAELPKIKNSEKNELLRERGQALESNYDEKFLKKNFRSKKEIVEFNNSFFSELSQKLSEKHKEIYKNCEQEFNLENTGGFVNVEIYRDYLIEDIRQKNLDRILEIIKESIAENFQLRDICILCRKNADASEIAGFLLENNMDVISSESLLLSNSAKVSFLVSFLKFIDNPTEKTHQVAAAIFLVLNGFIKEELHKTLLSVAQNESGNYFISALKNSGIEINIYQLQKLSLYESAEELIRIFSLNKTADPYISFFLDLVQSFVSQETSNISEFLKHWEKKKNTASIIIPEGMNAVSIMTIHKAKGLEFPVVIFPFANWREKLTKDYFWIDVENSAAPELKTAIVEVKKDLEQTVLAERYAEEKNKSLLDNFNLLYVAFTRAEERLYVLSSVEKQKNLSKNFIDVLQKHKGWDEEKNFLSFGEKRRSDDSREDEYRTPSEKTEDGRQKTENKQELKQLISSGWREKIYISSNAEKYTEAENQKNYGKLLHYALSMIYTADDVDAVMNKLAVSGICSVEEKQGLTNKIKNLLSNPDIKPFFEKGLNVKTEAEILLDTGETYRPDRVILSGNSAIIIDYKTGKQKEEHTQQVEKYAGALKKMGVEKIEKYLIYTEEENVVLL